MRREWDWQTFFHNCSFFKVRAGYKLFIAGYSRQEAGIIAGGSRDSNAIELFEAVCALRK